MGRNIIMVCAQALSIVIWVLLFLTTPVLAQTLTFFPSCVEEGKAATVCVTGSGWAEPSPVCRYKFFFDGVQVVFPDQPDGLSGPPLRSFMVPSTATSGDHTIRVELRQNNPDVLLQSRQSGQVISLIPFKRVPFFRVVTPRDPFRVQPNTYINAIGPIDIPNIGWIGISFNPTDICDIGSCDQLVLIQVMKGTGTKTGGGTEPVNWVTWGHNNGAGLEADKINDFVVDYVAVETTPYYNLDKGALRGTPGHDFADPKTSFMRDRPQWSDTFYPADFNDLTINFEVAVFCATGQSRGKFFGKVEWRWERLKGAATPRGTISITSPASRDAPSPGFIAALGKWNTNHGFMLPMPMASPSCR